MSRRSYPQVSFDDDRWSEHRPCQTCMKKRTRQMVEIRTSYMRGDDDVFACCHSCCKRYQKQGLLTLEEGFHDSPKSHYWSAVYDKQRPLARAIYHDVERLAPKAVAS